MSLYKGSFLSRFLDILYATYKFIVMIYMGAPLLENKTCKDATVNSVYEPIVLNITERKIGNTVFTLCAIQSEHAKETVEEKLKRIILRHIPDLDNY